MDALLHRRPPTNVEQFIENPLVSRSHVLLSRARVVMISDTHNHHNELPSIPDGDILIHACDLTQSGTLEELSSALQWLHSQPHPHKIFIAGNHDRALDVPSEELKSFLESYPSLVYLHATSHVVKVRGRTLLVYGSPLTPKHAEWAKIPRNTDILVTHGPPAYHLDGRHGCAALLAELWKVRPRLQVFGHIHAARGVENVAWSKAQVAYERICSAKGGLCDLVMIVAACFWGKDVTCTTFVNAASLGGFRDEQRRGAIAIDI
ncbi:metallophosphoesterase domain-containing protein 1 [Agrocybe pediades]|nr:metallophosphoesterase domain-containing protein 1 [Agrocybe pediades]